MTAATGSSPVTAGVGRIGGVLIGVRDARSSPVARDAEAEPGSVVASDVAARVASASAGTTAVTTEPSEQQPPRRAHATAPRPPRLQRFTTTFAPARIAGRTRLRSAVSIRRCSSGSAYQTPDQPPRSERGQIRRSTGRRPAPVPTADDGGSHRHDTIARRDIRLRLIGSKRTGSGVATSNSREANIGEQKIVVAVGDLVEQGRARPGHAGPRPGRARRPPMRAQRPGQLAPPPTVSSTTSGAAGSNELGVRRSRSGSATRCHGRALSRHSVAVSDTCGMQSQQRHRDRSQQSHGLTGLE